VKQGILDKLGACRFAKGAGAVTCIQQAIRVNG
jgi:hypothetical protein